MTVPMRPVVLLLIHARLDCHKKAQKAHKRKILNQEMFCAFCAFL